jgi:hypothetical protein
MASQLILTQYVLGSSPGVGINGSGIHSRRKRVQGMYTTIKVAVTIDAIGWWKSNNGGRSLIGQKHWTVNPGTASSSLVDHPLNLKCVYVDRTCLVVRFHFMLAREVRFLYQHGHTGLWESRVRVPPYTFNN